MKDIMQAVITWVILFAIRAAVIALGIVAVPMALLFAFEASRPRVQFQGYSGEWRDIRLPRWAYLWDNPSDGAMGDKRGWYWNEGRPAIIAKSDYLKAYYWLAFRNPANMFSRYLPVVSAHMPDMGPILVIGGDYFVRDKVGEEGWHFVKGKIGRITYYGFYGVWRYVKSNKAFVVRLGHKIEPRHNTEQWDLLPIVKQWKGMTFRVNPIKDIS